MQGFNQQHPALFAVIIFAIFSTWYVFVGWITSLVAGWRSLAGRYRTDHEYPEHKRRMQRAAMRSGMHFNNALTLGADSEGIYMGLTIPIMFGYPRLFIPWTDIQIEEPRRRWFFIARRLLLGPDAVPLRVREPLAQFLQEPRGSASAATSGMISSTF